jgi:hypothetical protein
MICYKCSEVIPDDSIFCPYCGIKLFVKCPKCGYEYSSRFKICNQCGTYRERDLEKTRILEQWRELTGSYNGTKVLGSKLDSISGQVVIPNGVTKIGDSAFEECLGLESIEMPDSITEIGDSAFKDCNGLTSVKIPDGVTKIGYYAFLYCYKLASIEIPDSVTEIGDSAFAFCYELASIEIPANVTRVGRNAFFFCDLKSISVSRRNNSFKSIQNCCLTKDGKMLVFGCMTSIIPMGVTRIGDSAFEGCGGLTSIELPDSVTEIGNSAFKACEGLTTVNIPSNVAVILDKAFTSCGLESINVSKENKTFKSIQNCCLSKDGKKLIFGCKTSIIPMGVNCHPKLNRDCHRKLNS